MAIIPHNCPFILAKPVIKVVPKSFLNSSNSDPSTILIIISLTSYTVLLSAGMIPSNSSGSYNGGLYLADIGVRFWFESKFLTHCLAIAKACSSLSARWSATPEIFV